MTHLELNPALLPFLKGKVVVLIGGATGIGRGAIEKFIVHGAKVGFGDLNDSAAQSLVSQVGSENILYANCNAASYADQLSLFEATERRFGRVDIAVGNAGVVIPQNPYAADSDVSRAPPMGEIDVNLKGAIFTSRIAAHYLRKYGGGDIVLTSSIAGFKESNGLPIYTASKHGVVGIVRGANLDLIKDDIRINVVCPWMTKTAMAKVLEDGWIREGLPTNEASDVADSILICATANRGTDANVTHMNTRMPFAGKILYASGGKTYEIEDRIQELEPQWLGEENSSALLKGQRFLSAMASPKEV